MSYSSKRLSVLARAFALMVCGVVFIASAEAQSKIATFTVGKEKADFQTVQEAIDHAPEAGAIIRIHPGTYREKISITKANITLLGVGQKASEVVLSFGDSTKSTGSTSKSWTLSVDGANFRAKNLTVENTWWIEHTDSADASQAVALFLRGDRAVLDNVRLLSGQDTLYAASLTCHAPGETGPCQASRQYFKNCYIEGHVDYIFGDAKAVFENCELHSRPHPTVMVTAQSRLFPGEDSGYYFLHCKITGADNGDKVILGRPWRTYSTVLFYDTEMQQKLAPEGWSDWDGRLKTSTYSEYRSHGPGVNGGNRIVSSAPLSPEEKKGLVAEKLLGGKDGWNPIKDAKDLEKLK